MFVYRLQCRPTGTKPHYERSEFRVLFILVVGAYLHGQPLLSVLFLSLAGEFGIVMTEMQHSMCITYFQDAKHPPKSCLGL